MRATGPAGGSLPPPCVWEESLDVPSRHCGTSRLSRRDSHVETLRPRARPRAYKHGGFTPMGPSFSQSVRSGGPAQTPQPSQVRQKKAGPSRGKRAQCASRGCSTLPNPKKLASTPSPLSRHPAPPFGFAPQQPPVWVSFCRFAGFVFRFIEPKGVSSLALRCGASERARELSGAPFSAFSAKKR